MVCIGEGEELIVELADRIDAGADYADIPGIWRSSATADHPEPGPRRCSTSTSSPSRTSSRRARCTSTTTRIRHNVYPLNLGRQYTIMTQRGCPFSCSFCIESVYQDMFGKKNSLRRRSVDVVIEELVQAKQNLDIRQVMFYDDVFTVNPRWLREFAPRYKARGRPALLVLHVSDDDPEGRPRCC